MCHVGVLEKLKSVDTPDDTFYEHTYFFVQAEVKKRQDEIDKARQEKQDAESVKQLEDALEEIKAVHEEEVEDLQGQIEYE